MPKRRKEGNKFTTISVRWEDKENMRRYASFKKETKNGKLYESDSEVFNKMLIHYQAGHKAGESKPTYPTALQDVRQRG